MIVCIVGQPKALFRYILMSVSVYLFGYELTVSQTYFIISKAPKIKWGLFPGFWLLPKRNLPEHE